MNIVVLIMILINVESSGNDMSIGDGGEAYGCLQIHEIYVKDVNRILGYEKFTHDDAFCRTSSMDMFIIYTGHYATAERIGREPTIEDIARIHNGGPNGWKKKSTEAYWHKVRKELL